MDKSTVNQSEKIIMGIDPGTTIMGYGMIRVKGKKVEMLTMGVIHLSKL
ncbi:MAG: crossover junction endodeoxyribonuclease RuvC, partial [Flavobacteriales bacterium]